jgi:hypothetical protein
MLTTHPLLVPRLRKSRSYTSSHPDAPLWSVTGPLYFFLLVHLFTQQLIKYNSSIFIKKAVSNMPVTDRGSLGEIILKCWFMNRKFGNPCCIHNTIDAHNPDKFKMDANQSAFGYHAI